MAQFKPCITLLIPLHPPSILPSPQHCYFLYQNETQESVFDKLCNTHAYPMCCAHLLRAFGKFKQLSADLCNLYAWLLMKCTCQAVLPVLTSLQLNMKLNCAKAWHTLAKASNNGAQKMLVP